jgi:DNA-directed RNA polymerase specialized sigma24 family protein
MNHSSERPDRSYLFALAVREFIHRRKSQKMLEAINAAHDDLPDPAEDSLQARMRAKHRELLVMTPSDVEE